MTKLHQKIVYSLSFGKHLHLWWRKWTIINEYFKFFGTFYFIFIFWNWISSIEKQCPQTKKFFFSRNLIISLNFHCFDKDNFYFGPNVLYSFSWCSCCSCCCLGSLAFNDPSNGHKWNEMSLSKFIRNLFYSTSLKIFFLLWNSRWWGQK